MTAACFDAEGRISDYLTLTDKIYEPGDGTEVREAPPDYDPARPLVLETTPCDHADIYVYVTANTFPVSAAIRDSPPFEIELAVSHDGNQPKVHPCNVNQWGGLTVKQTLG